MIYSISWGLQGILPSGPLWGSEGGAVQKGIPEKLTKTGWFGVSERMRNDH